MGDAGSHQGRPRTGRRAALAVVLLVLATYVAHAATVRPGHTWWGSDDFTAYLLHGRNLRAGRPYADVEVGPPGTLPQTSQRTAFPPALPLVLAAAEGTVAPPLPAQDGCPSGLPDLVALKRVLAVFFALSVGAAALAFRRAARADVLALSLLAYASCPYLFAFRELVRSEGLALLLQMLFFAALEGLLGRPDGERPGAAGAGRRLALAGAAGALAGLSYATRTAALVLLPTIVLADVVRRRRLLPSPAALLAFATGALLVLLQRAFVADVEQGYVAKAASEFGLATYRENVEQLGWNLLRLWGNGTSDALAVAVAGLTSALALAGFLARLRRPASFDVFAVLYGLLIVSVPTDSAWLRYLVPLLPMLFLYVFTGAALLARSGFTAVARRRRRLALGVAGLAVFGTWLAAFAHLPWGPLPDGLAAASTREAFAWVCASTAPDDVVVFGKPRALTLATGRPTVPAPRAFLHGPLDDAAVSAHLAAVGAAALVLKHSPPAPTDLYGSPSHSDEEFLHGWVARRAEEAGFREVLRNADFVVLVLAHAADG